ncbi:MAG: endonuclease/exonuclease/phosphatase family protein, partial [Pseudomonadota bacterium]
AAPDAARDAERFMRIASFNMWGKGDLHASRVEDFLKDSDADAVVLEEVRWKHEDFLKRLQATYPHQSGTHGLVILSKHPIVDKGRLDRPGEPYWRSLIVSWARLDVNGTEVDLVGAHMARPFFPAQHSVDLETLARFVASRPGHVIVAGDFNSAPWTRHLQSFATETGLRRLNTFQPTWPARWRELPLLPLLPIDNVFISSGLDRIEFTAGPRLESDHLPVIADIALAH